ncbi:FecR domain-containing protein [uncultured Maribacter sp.]|uniref:FecR family protein n=1 Tax=uncultured Maribacter sp. TaxID=431308 RepID=UPI0030D93BA4|tara:strand:- start:17479 stop:18633 length:1155 start_codon:yes stop_codon:yes gene_type:complete
MKKRNIKNIVHKFLSNTATTEEIEFLTKWVNNNKASFQEEIKLHHLVTGLFEEEKAESLKRELLDNIEQFEIRKRRSRGFNVLKYAAVFIGIITVGTLFYLGGIADKDLPQKQITITLGDGSTKEILEAKTLEVVSSSGTYVAEQEGSKIIYKKKSENTLKNLRPLVYNTLEVPYGKKFQIVLSDGTEVYLNSGSSLTYPVAFYDEGPRNVVLRGEAYFTVKSDSLRPFSVDAGLLGTKVLGTEFNISNYADDEYAKVVLVEGSVAVNEGGNPDRRAMVLKPHQMALYSLSGANLTVSDVDVSSHIAWKDGILLFKNEDFYRITQKLERHYDIEISIKDVEVGQERYTGRFKTETIDEVLQAFQRIKDFEYSISKNKIEINPKK